jgi:GNAT superfamily N-acetyltransferase
MAFEVSASVGLLADHPHLVAEVGLMRWREWGRAPEPTDPSFWVSVTGDEAGRISLPVSWVAVDADGQAVGAVGLGTFDIEERRDRSPWVLGMIVHPERRRRGIGRLLLATLSDWASSRGTLQVWVATGGAAVRFYNGCGWDTVETFSRGSEDTTVLTRHL